MSRGAAVPLALLGALGCGSASQRAPAAPKPTAPETATAPTPPPPQAQPANAVAPCRGERVLSLTPRRGHAPRSVASLFAPSLLARDDDAPEGALERLATAVLGAKPWPSAPESVELCRQRPGAPSSSNGRSDRARIFDLQRVTTTGGGADLTLALSSTDALEALLVDHDANWQVTLLDADNRVVAQSSFVTERPAQQTLDGVGAVLRLEHGLIHAHVAFGCADKNGERFDVPIELGPSCLNADASPFPPQSYPLAQGSASCTKQPLSASTPRRLPGYEDTHGKTGPWLAMPYVADDVAALDTDWLRVAKLLSPRAAEPVRAEPSEALEASAAVGSPSHATPRWSYVRGAGLRLYQLLPVRNDRDREAYLALYSHDPPHEIVRSERSEWHVALLSPSYALLSDVAFTTAPAPGRYVALQTELEVRDGQPTASVQYLKSLPGPSNAGTPGFASGVASFRRRLRVDVDRGCTALESP